MHFTVCLSILLTPLSAEGSDGTSWRYGVLSEITTADHGKVVEFERKEYVMRKKITYFHKGIIFVPRAFRREIYFTDANDDYISYNEVYIIHFWHPGPHKDDASIRIDKLGDVILGDPWRVLEDGDGVFPVDETIDKAISELGQRSRRMRYSLAGNNCGNFVARMKRGRGDYDEQFPNTVNTILGAKAPFLVPIARFAYNKASSKYKRRDNAHGGILRDRRER